MIRKLSSYIKQYKLYSILAPITVAIEVALEVAIPFIVSFIVDEGMKKNNTKVILTYGAITIGLAMLSLLFGAMSAVFAAKASTGFIANLRKGIFAKIQDFSFHNTDKFSSASLITRLTTDLNFIQNAFMVIIRLAIRAPLMFVSSLVMCIILNAKLSLVFMAVIPLILIVAVLLMRIVVPLFEVMFKKFDKMNSRVQENLQAIRMVKSFVRENHETEEFRKVSRSVLESQRKAEKIIVFAMPLMQLSIYATMIAIIWFGGKLIIAKGMSEGEFMSFIQYINMVLIAFMTISMVIINVVFSKASAKRVVEVLDEKIDITDEGRNPDLKVSDGSIELNNISFNYNKGNDNYLLQNLNLKIKSGESVGIIGGTGSGKTTLTQLISRFYDVEEGEVKVGGVNVKDYTLRNLRDSVSMVLQKNTLFSGTIKENLLWGKEDATDEEIDFAATTACAKDFIKSFPDGYDSRIDQGGVNVSGGQKQRLCIARALLKKPKIIIFDDSTSAVDTATDSHIRKALRENLKETTVIIIAQRISSVMDLDKIVVMDEGRIEAIGTHKELLKTNEIYKEIYELQSRVSE